MIFEEQGRTHQEMAEACDINKIMARYEKGQLISHVNTYEGRYGDFTETPGDFHSAMNQTIAATEMFMTLPAAIRKKFNNDPGTFLDYTQDPENEASLREMGLLPPGEQETPKASSAESEPAPETSSAASSESPPSTVPT